MTNAEMTARLTRLEDMFEDVRAGRIPSPPPDQLKKLEYEAATLRRWLGLPKKS